jgi:hypothetical protein
MIWQDDTALSELDANGEAVAISYFEIIGTTFKIQRGHQISQLVRYHVSEFTFLFRRETTLFEQSLSSYEDVSEMMNLCKLGLLFIYDSSNHSSS